MTAVVIGAGPAGLMAAEVMAEAGLAVTVHEARPSPARKFLMAGKSGLNLTFEGDAATLLSGYGDRAEVLRPALGAFDNRALRDWAERLGMETFAGSTGRVFPRTMKASPLLRAWLGRLGGLGVRLQRQWRWTGWDADALVFATPDGVRHVQADVTVLACGGASWARLGSDGAWAEWLPSVPFRPSNVGLAVDWTPHMAAHFGTALKSVRWSAGEMTSRGEAVITRTGLEGGGIYALTPALREGHALTVDLVPDLSAEDIAGRFARRPPKTRLVGWLRNTLRLGPEKVALVMEVTRGATDMPPQDWARLLKALPVNGARLGPLDGAISTAGGVPFSALTEGFMLRDRPGVFCAGEMLDWEAPTGGWLLTACFATGRWAGQHAAGWLQGRPG